MRITVGQLKYLINESVQELLEEEEAKLDTEEEKVDKQLQLVKLLGLKSRTELEKYKNLLREFVDALNNINLDKVEEVKNKISELTGKTLSEAKKNNKNLSSAQREKMDKNGDGEISAEDLQILRSGIKKSSKRSNGDKK